MILASKRYIIAHQTNLAQEEQVHVPVSEILDLAIELNDGLRRDALTKLSERIGTHVNTIRLWDRGAREIPPDKLDYLRTLAENKRLATKLERAKAALEE